MYTNLMQRRTNFDFHITEGMGKTCTLMPFPIQDSCLFVVEKYDGLRNHHPHHLPRVFAVRKQKREGTLIPARLPVSFHPGTGTARETEPGDGQGTRKSANRLYNSLLNHIEI